MTTFTEVSVLPDYDWSEFKRVLIVVAHPDDAEYGLSCAVDTWTRAGVEVGYLLLTHGEAGIRTMDPAEVGPLRAEEQREACAAVGVSDLTLLEHPDGQLVESMELRRDIARHIRRFRPDTVITANFELEAYGTFNQADHRVAGLMTVDAVRDADNPWVHRDLDLPAHKTSRLLVANPGQPTHRIVVDEPAEQAGIRSLTAHKAYFEALPDHPKPEEFIPAMLTQPDGGKAVAFRVFEQI
ncbi:PIG-L family deacetylase [Corynebacterium sp. YIM 101645]|uniref:PIG-L family deacetylase n=1 Tax=Corynebacterium lemuris TaxID=1859292 RepID=A0ABT2FWF6_9CORY|nr:PIG-L deacetylase family protein [Corynebacterium lemuris]MCS5478818.1 PIG-L family deacetylase [Corynebacterium lemuris]